MWTRGPALFRSLTTHVIDLNGVINSGATSAVGVVLSGLNPLSSYAVTQPSGRLYAGWSAWATDGAGPLGGAWLCIVRVTATAGPTWEFGGSRTTYPTGEEARLDFITGIITGYSQYTFWISESAAADNRGGLSLTVDEI